MRKIKPKTLYRFFNMTVEKFKVPSDCLIALEVPLGFVYPDGSHQRYGDVFRCQSNGRDFHGYASLKEAKAEHIDVVKKEIFDRQEWLRKASA